MYYSKERGESRQTKCMQSHLYCLEDLFFKMSSLRYKMKTRHPNQRWIKDIPIKLFLSKIRIRNNQKVTGSLGRATQGITSVLRLQVAVHDLMLMEILQTPHQLAPEMKLWGKQICISEKSIFWGCNLLAVTSHQAAALQQKQERRKIRKRRQKCKMLWEEMTHCCYLPSKQSTSTLHRSHPHLHEEMFRSWFIELPPLLAPGAMLAKECNKV